MSRVVPLNRGTSARSGDVIAHLALRIRGSRTRAPRLAFVDAETAAPVAEWHGDIARHLLDAPALDAIVAGDGDYPCSQACLKRVMLAAAAIEASLEQLAERRDAALAGAAGHGDVAAGFAPEALGRRLARLGACLDGSEALVARLLFEHPGEHFTARDVTCLVGLAAPACNDVDVAPVLDALVDRAVIQRIDLFGGPSFYDIDTRPHAHRYDAATGRLFDVGPAR